MTVSAPEAQGVILRKRDQARLAHAGSQRLRSPSADCGRKTLTSAHPWIAAANARKVEKLLELTLSGEWTTEEARMLSECVRIRVLR